jgi:hypothetical protein
MAKTNPRKSAICAGPFAPAICAGHHPVSEAEATTALPRPPSRHANRVRWVANAQRRRPPLPAEEEDALFARFRRSPELIERFEWPPASRPRFEE